MKNLTRQQTIELVDIMVDINLTQDCESHYMSNGFYLMGFLKKYSDVDEKVLDRFKISNEKVLRAKDDPELRGSRNFVVGSWDTEHGPRRKIRLFCNGYVFK
jgi:hypothetical protein